MSGKLPDYIKQTMGDKLDAASAMRNQTNRIVNTTTLDSPKFRNVVNYPDSGFIATAINDISGQNAKRSAMNVTPFGHTESNLDAMLQRAYLDAMGATKQSGSEEIAAAVNKLVGFNSPLMVIKPRFITEAQRKEMMLMIRNGIPLLSVGDINSKSNRIAEAMRTFDNFNMPYGIRQRQDEER